MSAIIKSGKFTVGDREWAQAVAETYTKICALSPSLKKKQFLSACMAAFKVDGFDPTSLISGAERCRDKLVSYSTRDAYLTMLEDVYNFGRQKLFGLKTAALNQLKKRDHVEESKKKGKK